MWYPASAQILYGSEDIERSVSHNGNLVRVRRAEVSVL